MDTITINLWGYNVWVEYELTDDSIDLNDYGFESEEAADDCGLYSESTRAHLEEEIVQKIAEYEQRQRDAQKWIRPYREAKRRRNLYRKFDI